MGRDYYAILGLSPGRYDPAEIARRFQAERARLLAFLHQPATYGAARRHLEELHLAYAALRDPGAQAEYLRAGRGADDRVAQVRQLIAASLEDGLLRYSRRQEILSVAQHLGFSEFQAQLLIAQVQFGDERIPLSAGNATGGLRSEPPRTWARLAAVGVLALALFLAMVRWLGA
jgi:hypothetical protein